MLPDPLHPAIVHFPIVLAAILPLALAWALFRSRREVSPWTAWTPALAIGLLLAATATIGVETGEDQEELVEDVVSEEVIHEHEEAAQLLQRSSIAVLVIMALGLVPKLPRRGAQALQWFALAGSLALLPLIWKAGETGGELVYRHGAAQVHVDAASAVPGAARNRGHDHDD